MRWSADDLAEKARIGIATLRRAEGNDGILNMTLANQDAIRAALERAGVEFIAVDETSPGAGAGVRLKVRNV